MKRVYFLIMVFFFTSNVFCQEIWPRTYAGYKDAATDGIEDEQENVKGIFRVYDVQNQLHYESKETNLEFIQLDVSHWKKGYYFFKFQCASGEVIELKLLVK